MYYLEREPWTAERIKSFRRRLGLTQTQFGEKLHVSYVTVNRWENNHKKPLPVMQHMLDELEKAWKLLRGAK